MNRYEHEGLGASLTVWAAVVGALAVLLIWATGCTTNKGGKLLETITRYDTDGNVTSVETTQVDAGFQVTTIGAKQEEGASNFHYESDEDGFLIQTGTVAKGQSGEAISDIVGSLTELATSLNPTPAPVE